MSEEYWRKEAAFVREQRDVIAGQLSQEQARSRRYREALESCYNTDRSKEYEYGERDRQDNAPGAGKRWLTPKEIARAALADEAGEPAKCDCSDSEFCGHQGGIK